MSDTKMKFHITITDNETGDVMQDTDACAIIGGFNNGVTTCTFAATNCGPFDIARTLASAEEAVDGIYELHPELKALATFLKISRAQEESKNEE